MYASDSNSSSGLSSGAGSGSGSLWHFGVNGTRHFRNMFSAPSRVWVQSFWGKPLKHLLAFHKYYCSNIWNLICIFKASQRIASRLSTLSPGCPRTAYITLYSYAQRQLLINSLWNKCGRAESLTQSDNNCLIKATPDEQQEDRLKAA